MKRSFETANVVLWLGNDLELYTSLRRYAEAATKPTYREFIWGLKKENAKTPDGVAWIGSGIDYEDLDDFVCEIGGAQ